jgi:hypothetical protein
MSRSSCSFCQRKTKSSAEMPRFKSPNNGSLPHPCNEQWRNAVKSQEATQVKCCACASVTNWRWLYWALRRVPAPSDSAEYGSWWCRRLSDLTEYPKRFCRHTLWQNIASYCKGTVTENFRNTSISFESFFSRFFVPIPWLFRKFKRRLKIAPECFLSSGTTKW